MNDLVNLYWDTQKSVSLWLAEHLPGQGVLLPVKLAAGGMAVAADQGASKTLAEKITDYSYGVAVTAASVPETSVSPEMQSTIQETMTSAKDAVINQASELFTLPPWFKFAIVAAGLLAVYELTSKGKA